MPVFIPHWVAPSCFFFALAFIIGVVNDVRRYKAASSYSSVDSWSGIMQTEFPTVEQDGYHYLWKLLSSLLFLTLLAFTSYCFKSQTLSPQAIYLRDLNSDRDASKIERDDALKSIENAREENLSLTQKIQEIRQDLESTRNEKQSWQTGYQDEYAAHLKTKWDNEIVLSEYTTESKVLKNDVQSLESERDRISQRLLKVKSQIKSQQTPSSDVVSQLKSELKAIGQEKRAVTQHARGLKTQLLANLKSRTSPKKMPVARQAPHLGSLEKENKDLTSKLNSQVEVNETLFRDCNQLKARNAAKDDSITKMDDEIKGLNSEAADIRKTNAEMKGKYAAKDVAIAEMEEEIKRLNSQAAATKKASDEQSLEVVQLRETKDRLEKDLHEKTSNEANPSQTSEDEDMQDVFNPEVDALKSRIELLEQQLNSRNGDINKYKADLEKANSSLADLVPQSDSMDHEHVCNHSVCDSDRRSLQGQVRDLTAKLGVAKSQAKTPLAFASKEQDLKDKEEAIVARERAVGLGEQAISDFKKAHSANGGQDFQSNINQTGLQQEIVNLKRERNELQKKIGGAPRSNTALQREVKARKEDNERHEKLLQKANDDAAKDFRQLKVENDGLRRLISTRKGGDDSANQLRDELAKAKEEHSRTEKRLLETIQELETARDSGVEHSPKVCDFCDTKLTSEELQSAPESDDPDFPLVCAACTENFRQTSSGKQACKRRRGQDADEDDQPSKQRQKLDQSPSEAE